MGSLACPACGGDVSDQPVIGMLSICPNQSCLASLVLEGYHYRRAVAADTTVLADDELAALRKARKRYREAA